ncbi:hypothetical protein CU665_15670 [Pseudomonas syringae pv. actinidifoliorum]|nr:hypothetical protein [Pseudomonas syringae pv. actinidifoliorum]NAT40261.1 hypothetical protein [Pseudomonas syringae pv. actinidifoliorum]
MLSSASQPSASRSRPLKACSEEEPRAVKNNDAVQHANAKLHNKGVDKAYRRIAWEKERLLDFMWDRFL